MQGSTELGRLVRSAVSVKNITDQEASYTVIDGRRWPTYITGEDTISIEMLTDYDSPEWMWLRGMYDRLADEVASDGARLVIMVLPLAYQMDAEYPFLPQSLFARYCEERSLMCLDLLPAFQRARRRGTVLWASGWAISTSGTCRKEGTMWWPTSFAHFSNDTT